jgi:hypothetical protein
VNVAAVLAELEAADRRREAADVEVTRAAGAAAAAFLAASQCHGQAASFLFGLLGHDEADLRRFGVVTSRGPSASPKSRSNDNNGSSTSSDGNTTEGAAPAAERSAS